MRIFRTGNGSATSTIIIALELISPDWFRRNLIGALELMCNPENWEVGGDATIDFARDKANEMLEGIEIDVHIPIIPVGMISMFGDSVPPMFWLPCDGRAVGRTDYAALFGVIGTQYGVGDGTTTFNLPNMVDKIPMSFGGAVVPNIGNKAGALTHTNTVAEMPAHNHNFAQTPHTHLLNDPGHTHPENAGAVAAFLATGGTGRVGFGVVSTSNTTPVNTVQAGTAITVQTANANITLNSQGSGTPHSILNPVLGVNFIIYSGV